MQETFETYDELLRTFWMTYKSSPDRFFKGIEDLERYLERDKTESIDDYLEIEQEDNEEQEIEDYDNKYMIHREPQDELQFEERYAGFQPNDGNIIQSQLFQPQEDQSEQLQHQYYEEDMEIDDISSIGQSRLFIPLENEPQMTYQDEEEAFMDMLD